MLHDEQKAPTKGALVLSNKNAKLFKGIQSKLFKYITLFQ